ncbi:DUF3107 domain-containing protein [Demequina activiva]|uniref:ATP-binding protein n=1 Tax=Demequina activiva TaxID=1582364 RepID=A0A919Q4D6_9MICO|nr:DUF3107 domain-containing protein [Demequina activiva]GIG55349.1 ATP-binding protein [Demequina activiva]
MEIRIGIQNVAREIVLETDMGSDEVAKAVADALAGATLDVSDTKGRRLVVPAGALGYVEIGEESKRRVGFNA